MTVCPQSRIYTLDRRREVKQLKFGISFLEIKWLLKQSAETSYRKKVMKYWILFNTLPSERGQYFYVKSSTKIKWCPQDKTLLSLDIKSRGNSVQSRIFKFVSLFSYQKL
jgi:hypothetical protein